MAFNRRTFITRTITSIVFVVIMLVGLLWNRWSFFILFSIIHFGCWWEYLRLTEKICKTTIDRVIKYVLIISGYILFLILGFPDISIDFGIYLGTFFFSIKWAIYFLLIFCLGIYLFQNKKILLKAKWLSLTALLYISLSLGLMMNMYKITDIHTHDTMLVVNGSIVPVTIIISLWTNDTMAYIIGSLIGKTSLSSISPKKTWEGTIGGIILSIIVVAAIAYNYSLHNKVIGILAGTVAAITSVAGTFGDLFESKLKRMANVKDSGSIMPGHGGFLDRFDSLLFAIPFVWMFVYFFTS